MDLQNRQELLELHHQNNDTFGVALETSKNTADALLVLASIHKAPKEIATLIPTLKNAGSVVFNGVKYTYSEGKIVAQKILSPNTNVNAHVPTNKDLPKVYGDGDLENVYDYRTPLKLDNKKFDYFFGKVDSSDHNHYRSLQNQRQLNSIGIFDNEFGKSLLTDSINKQIQNPSNVIDRREEIHNGVKQAFETREMLLVGPNGIRMMVVDFEIMPNHSRRVTTIIIKGGN